MNTDFAAIKKRTETYAKTFPWKLEPGGKDYIARDRAALVAEVERLQAFVDDLAWNGIRFDLNPTVDLQNMGRAYTGYLERIDASIRSRAGRHSSRPAPSATSDSSSTGSQS